MPDYSEFVAAQKAKPAQPGATPSLDQIRAYLDRLDAIAGQLTTLTQSEGWNLHMAHLTGNRTVREQELDPLKDRIVRGADVGDALTTLKLRAAYLQGGLDALGEAMGDAQEVINANTAARAAFDGTAAPVVLAKV